MDTAFLFDIRLERYILSSVEDIPCQVPLSEPVLDIIGDLLRKRVFFIVSTHDLQAEKNEHSHRVACGCPGGSSGNAEISTTRNPRTPKTLAYESTTAAGSLS